MSGKKTSFISLSQEQYQTLHNAFIKNLFFGGNRDNAQTRNDQELQNRVDYDRDQILNREKEFTDLAFGLSRQIQDMELQSNSAVVKSEEKMRRQILENSDLTETRLLSLLDENLQSFNDQILDQHHQQQNQITRLRRQILNMEQNQESRAVLAAEWLENSRKMFEFIDTHYAHPQFAPGKLKALSEDFQLALQNYDMGLYEAALVAAQNLYRRVSELRLALERDEQVWRACYALALKEIDKQLDQFESRSQYQYQPDGGGKAFSVDINYWSNGLWLDIKKRLEAIKDQLIRHAEQLSVADLRLYLNETLPALAEKQDNLFNQAGQNLVDSQIRTNIADLVMKALQKQGYELDGSQFEGNDLRKGFKFVAENISGNAVSVLINTGTAEKNEILLESMDKKPQTEHFLKQRAQEIAVSLRKFGLSMDEFIQKAAGGYDLGRQGRLVAEEKTRYVTR